MRFGARVGPFWVSGGGRRDGGGAELFGYLMIMCIVGTTIALAAALAFLGLLLFPIIASASLSMLVVLKRDFQSLTSREEWLWRNRNGLLSSIYLPVVLGIISLILWNERRDDLSLCFGSVDCASAREQYASVKNSTQIYLALNGILAFSSLGLLFSRIFRAEIWSLPANKPSQIYREIWAWLRGLLSKLRGSPGRFIKRLGKKVEHQVERWEEHLED